MIENNCLFCKIIAGLIPSKKIFEDDEVFAFYDINPQAPVHFLVVPKRHISSLTSVREEDSGLTGKLLAAAQKLAVELGCGENGFRLVINCGPDAGQSVDHLHLHVLGGRSLAWPPG